LNVLRLEEFEAGGFDRDRIGAGLEMDDAKDARSVGGCELLGAGAVVVDDNAGAGYDGAGLVFDCAADGAVDGGLGAGPAMQAPGNQSK
jgi:hypothetical protein